MICLCDLSMELEGYIEYIHRQRGRYIRLSHGVPLDGKAILSPTLQTRWLSARSLGALCSSRRSSHRLPLHLHHKSTATLNISSRRDRYRVTWIFTYPDIISSCRNYHGLLSHSRGNGVIFLYQHPATLNSSPYHCASEELPRN